VSWKYDVKEVENNLEVNGIGKDATERAGVARKILDILKTALSQALKGAPDILFVCAAYGYGRWAAVYTPTGKVIGFARLKYLEDLGEVDFLGFRFFKEHWGKGLANEASKVLVSYGFDTLQFKRIIGMADIENKASIRVLEKVGFQFERFTTFRDHDVGWYAIERPQDSGRGADA
jgi:predicted acetyltransferase